MVKLKNFDESKIDEYSIEELQSLINEVDMTRSVIREKLTAEMAEKLKDDKFDAFSFFGQRKLRKIAKKYDGAYAGAEIYMSILKKELAKTILSPRQKGGSIFHYQPAKKGAVPHEQTSRRRRRRIRHHRPYRRNRYFLFHAEPLHVEDPALHRKEYYGQGSCRKTHHLRSGGIHLFRHGKRQYP